MGNHIKRRRESLEEGQDRSSMVVNQQVSQMQRLELMENIAIALRDVLSANHAELSPVPVISVTGLECVPQPDISDDALSFRYQVVIHY
jgi:hypothetical protein